MKLGIVNHKEERERLLTPLISLAKLAELTSGPSLKVVQEQILAIPVRQARAQADFALLEDEVGGLGPARFEETTEASSSEELMPLTMRLTEAAGHIKAVGRTLKVQMKVKVEVK